MAAPLTRQRTPLLDLLRERHSEEWDIYRTTAKWYAVRRNRRASLKAVSASTAAGLLHDLERIEEAAK